MRDVWVLVAACGAATYLWRALGMLLSGRIHAEGELFIWVRCVAYAMVAGLVSRMVIMPTGMLAASALADRLVACVIGVLVYRKGGGNLFVAVGAGVAVVMAFGYGRTLI